MQAQVLQQSRHTLSLSAEERDSLLGLLRHAIGEIRVELHRTHTPVFRDFVSDQEAVIRALIEKLERAAAVQTEASPSVAAGIEEGLPLPDVIYIDEQGRFQMAMEDLEDFIQFLRDNKVRVEAETAEAFHSGDKAYGYGRLLHVFDTNSVNALYRTWKQAQKRGPGWETA